MKTIWITNCLPGLVGHPQNTLPWCHWVVNFIESLEIWQSRTLYPGQMSQSKERHRVSSSAKFTCASWQAGRIRCLQFHPMLHVTMCNGVGQHEPLPPPPLSPKMQLAPNPMPRPTVCGVADNRWFCFCFYNCRKPNNARCHVTPFSGGHFNPGSLGNHFRAFIPSPPIYLGHRETQTDVLYWMLYGLFWHGALTRGSYSIFEGGSQSWTPVGPNPLWSSLQPPSPCQQTGIGSNSSSANLTSLLCTHLKVKMHWPDLTFHTLQVLSIEPDIHRSPVEYGSTREMLFLAEYRKWLCTVFPDIEGVQYFR